MVNQQARWAPAHRAVKRLIDRGILGHVYSVMHVIRSFQDVPGSYMNSKTGLLTLNLTYDTTTMALTNATGSIATL